MIDESIARGLVRQHLRHELPATEKREQITNKLIDSIYRRLQKGQVISKPTTEMSSWRHIMATNGGQLIQLYHYRRAVHLWTGWIPQLVENSLQNPDEDIEVKTLVIMADGLDITRTQAVAVNTTLPLEFDQHVLKRWLQRQPGDNEIESYETAVMQLLPMAMAQNYGLTQHSMTVPTALPMGDGLVLGRVTSMTSHQLNTLGLWSAAKYGCQPLSSRILAPRMGKIEGNRVRFTSWQGATFYGPRELKRDLQTIRSQLLSWQDVHKAGLQQIWGHVAEAVLTNHRPTMPQAMHDAIGAFVRIAETPMWLSAINNRGIRSIKRKRPAIAAQQSKGNNTQSIHNNNSLI